MSIFSHAPNPNLTNDVHANQHIVPRRAYHSRSMDDFDPGAESDYWFEEHVERPYYDPSYSYAQYEPAFRLGWESRRRMVDSDWDEVEAQLKQEWEVVGERSPLSWALAKEAARDAWEHLTDYDAPTPRPIRRR